MKPTQLCLWGLVLAVGLCAGLGLATLATANDEDATGDFYIGNTTRGAGAPPGGGSDSGEPGGLEADPDTFSVDSRTITLRDIVRYDPWTSQGAMHRGFGWVLRLAVAKILAAW